MSDIIREYRESDRGELTRLWLEIFGDDESYISYFLENLASYGVGAVAECDGHAVAMAYAVTGLEYEEKRIAYIYAVATGAEHRGRGLGEAVSRKAAELSEADIIATFPAEDSLYAWYEKILGLDSSLFTEELRLEAKAGEEARRIDSYNYNSIRESLLKDCAHVSLTDASAALEEKLCLTYGGGLYECAGTVMAAYCDGEHCFVREALGGDALSAASSLAHSLGAKEAVLRRAAKTGTPFVAIENSALAEGTVWNIAFD